MGGVPLKLQLSCAYLLLFFNYGIFFSMLGPTLLELGHNTNRGVAMLSFGFTSRAFGILGGIIGSGVMVKQPALNGWRAGNSIMAVAIGSLGMVSALIPIVRELWLLVLVLWMQGLCYGLVYNLGNIFMLRTHSSTQKGDSENDQSSKSWMLALHCSLGVGATLGPLLAGLFVPPEHPIEEHTLQFAWAYWVGSIMLIPVSIWLLVLGVRQYSQEELEELDGTPESQETEALLVDEDATRKADVEEGIEEGSRAPVHRSWIIFLAALFICIFKGAEVSYADLVYSYARKSLQFSVAYAALLNSLFWASFATGRVISIPIQWSGSLPANMVFFDLIGSLLALAVTITYRESSTMLFAGTMCLGVFCASVLPSSINLVVQVVAVDVSVISLLTMGEAIGMMTVPLLTGNLFDMIGPQAFLWTIFGAFATISVIFMFLLYATNGRYKLKSAVQNTAAACH